MAFNRSPYFKFATQAGDGTGQHDIIGDYSGAPADFKVTASAGRVLVISRVIVQIADTFFSPSFYGDISGGLQNGIKIVASIGGVEYDLTGGQPVKTNAEWAHFCYDVRLKDWGPGLRYYSIRWTFDKSGRPIKLAPGDFLAVRVNDNLSSLEKHSFNFQGYTKPFTN